jgi:hypothetical protein
LLRPVIEGLAKRDASRAQSLTHGLLHQGFYSIAQLAIARALLRDDGMTKKELERITK